MVYECSACSFGSTHAGQHTCSCMAGMVSIQAHQSTDSLDSYIQSNTRLLLLTLFSSCIPVQILPSQIVISCFSQTLRAEIWALYLQITIRLTGMCSHLRCVHSSVFLEVCCCPVLIPQHPSNRGCLRVGWPRWVQT